MSKMYIRVDDDETTNNSTGRLSSSRLPRGVREMDSADLANKMCELRQQLDEVFSKVETVG